MNQIINQDFELQTFYWMYAKCNAGTVTYTVECFETQSGEISDQPYMIIQTSTGAICGHIVQEVGAGIIDARVIDAIRKHFSQKFMLEDGFMMMAEYFLQGASGELHVDPVHGQAIFGMDLEEAVDNS